MKKLNKKGFTLVELLAVIVVLAILATVAITNVVPMMNKSKLGTTGSSLANIITSGFQTCATSQASSSTISANCKKDKIASDYIQNLDSKNIIGDPTVSDTKITITYKDNDYTIAIKDCEYSEASKALAQIKDYYEKSNDVYTLTCEKGKLPASNIWVKSSS